MGQGAAQHPLTQLPSVEVSGCQRPEPPVRENAFGALPVPTTKIHQKFTIQVPTQFHPWLWAEKPPPPAQVVFSPPFPKELPRTPRAKSPPPCRALLSPPSTGLSCDAKIIPRDLGAHLI